MDDVWEKVELKDIGLSPLPNGVKLLLTSRDENVCTKIVVEANSDHFSSNGEVYSSIRAFLEI